MIGPYVLSLGLLGLSGWMIDRHRRKWANRQATADQKGDADDRHCYAHCRSQHRRRMVASSAIGVAGALIGVYPVVPREPGWMMAYLAVLVLSCLVMLACAVLDAFAGARFYRRVTLEHKLKQAQLVLELELKRAAEKQAAAASDEA